MGEREIACYTGECDRENAAYHLMTRGGTRGGGGGAKIRIRGAIFYTGEVTYGARRNLPFSSWVKGGGGWSERVENKR